MLNAMKDGYGRKDDDEGEGEYATAEELAEACYDALKAGDKSEFCECLLSLVHECMEGDAGGGGGVTLHLK